MDHFQCDVGYLDDSTRNGAANRYAGSEVGILRRGKSTGVEPLLQDDAVVLGRVLCESRADSLNLVIPYQNPLTF